MGNVSVNKGLLIGVVAVAAASLLALMFVLGRESGSGGVSAPSTRIERVAQQRKEQPLPLQTPAVAWTDRAETRPDSGAALQAASSQVPAPVGGERGNAGSEPERAAVVAYFDVADRIQAGAMSGEAEGVANEMAAALANGDTSSLDKMIRQTETAKASLAAVTPPAPCASVHRETLASLDDSLEVLRSMKSAMESSEPAARLASVATRATTLRSRAEALQREELALRQRYGLKR